MREDWIEIEYKKAVGKISTSKQKLKQSEYLQTGKIPVIDQGQQLIAGFTDDESKVLDCKLPVVVFGDHTKIVKLINFPFVPGADGTKVLEPINCIIPKYLAFLTEVLAFKIKDKGYARHYQHIEKELLPITSLPEQRAIVQKIESYFALLDKGIADLKTAQEQLKTYRQAVLKKAFEGEFTNKNIKEGKLPESWKWVKLGDVAEINPKLPNKEEITSSLEIQFLPMKLVEEEINKIHLIETRLFHEVQKGSYTPFIEEDIIFAKVTPCMENGKIAVTKNLKNGIGYGSSEFHVIRCTDKILNTYIFHYVVQLKFRKEAENQMTGAVGLRRVPKKFLEDYLIPFPPTLSEQHAIVREIEFRLSVCDKVEQSISEALEKAEALRQSILKKAFEGGILSEGEITACKQEPDYEPASVLLERIKKEEKHGK